MRRLRNDLPYRFRPPMMNAWLRPLGLAVNRKLHLGRKYNIGRIVDEGFAAVRELSEAGHAVMLAPNHSDHSDPHVVMEVAQRHGMRAVFMAAREVFESSPVTGWALQRKFPPKWRGRMRRFPLFYAGWTTFWEFLFSGYICRTLG
jgi:1-acyl-sn-glycerol-3-phosphate acyltransferase